MMILFHYTDEVFPPHTHIPVTTLCICTCISKSFDVLPLSLAVLLATFTAPTISLFSLTKFESSFISPTLHDNLLRLSWKMYWLCWCMHVFLWFSFFTSCCVSYFASKISVARLFFTWLSFCLILMLLKQMWPARMPSYLGQQKKSGCSPSLGCLWKLLLLQCYG